MFTKRGWGFRLLALALGLCSLLGIELIARGLERSAGRPANEFFYTRVYERQGGTYVTREARRWFFRTREFPAVKSPSAVRIFILGGSSAIGFPYQGQYGMAELLTSALPVVRGGRSYEVINAAGFGYNTSRVAAVAEEVLDYQPDVLVVMTGHNEFLEKRVGGAWDFAAGRLFIGLERRLLGRQDTVRWEAHDVSADERGRVEAGMEAALRRVEAKARRKGVKLVLVTCPSNLTGFRPNGPSTVADAERVKIDALLKTGRDADKAKTWVDDQERQHPDDAWVLFMKGRLVAALGGNDEWARQAAERLFIRARDLDTRPVRATTSINDLIRKLGREWGAALVDAERIFIDRQGEAQGGDESVFLDHCHPSYVGQWVLAEAVLDGLGETEIISAPGADQLAACYRLWKDAYFGLPASNRAEFYYRAAFEVGMNMDRPCRGFDLAGRALTEDPTDQKAIKLRERLRPAGEAGCLTGD